MALLFRPSLSLDEINYLITKCQEDSSNPIALFALQKLQKFSIKASVGLITPSHRKDSIEEKLGFQLREPACYIKWQVNPALCTKAELDQIKQYRYEAGLMAASEEAEYELEIMSGD
jgi:hypothetical protein